MTPIMQSDVDAKRFCIALKDVCHAKLKEIKAKCESDNGDEGDKLTMNQYRILEVCMNRFLQDVVKQVQDRLHVDANLKYARDEDIEPLNEDLAIEVLELEERLVEVEKRVIHHRENTLKQLAELGTVAAVETLVEGREENSNVENLCNKLSEDMEESDRKKEIEEMVISVTELVSQLKNKLTESIKTLQF
jgi:hypothetical protein